MEKNELKNLVSNIVEKANILKDKYTEEKTAQVNYACVFSHDDEEFVSLNEAAKSLGNIVKETPTGSLFRIEPLDTVAGKLQLLKIRKPDQTRMERGDADFTVKDYDSLKKKHISQDFFKLIQRDDFEMIELMNPMFDVRVYFSNPPLGEQLEIK